jgi:hypothetical protein
MRFITAIDAYRPVFAGYLAFQDRLGPIGDDAVPARAVAATG